MELTSVLSTRKTGMGSPLVYSQHGYNCNHAGNLRKIGRAFQSYKELISERISDFVPQKCHASSSES